MRRLLILTAVWCILGPVSNAYPQSKTYKVQGKTVRLDVDPDHILVIPKQDGQLPRSAVFNEPFRLAAVTEAFQAQSRVGETAPLAVAAIHRLNDTSVTTVGKLSGYIVPRISPNLKVSDFHGLARQTPGLATTALVYKYQGRMVLVPGTVSVRFKEAPPATLPGLQEIERPTYTKNVVRVRAAQENGDGPFAIVEKLQAQPGVLWAEADLIYQVRACGGAPDTKIPNDTYFDKQWYLKSIRAPEAWAVTTGSDRITVAVLDDGVDLNHKDLKPKLVKGYDFYDNANDPQPAETDAHGTCCAGIIAAKPHNMLGVAGIAWDCKVMPLRISGRNSFASDPDIAKAIGYARDKGAKILSCSWGGGPPSQKIVDALESVTNDGCLVFAAAGNVLPEGLDCFFPASDKNCIAVGALHRDDTLWNYSCYGPEKEISFVAPSGDVNLKGDIWTTDNSGKNGYNPGGNDVPDAKGDKDGDYTGLFGGTSAATPVVAGVAALVWSVKPELKAAEVRKILEDTAIQVDKANANYGSDRKSKRYGFGKVDALEAVRKVKAMTTPPPAGNSGALPLVGGNLVAALGPEAKDSADNREASVNKKQEKEIQAAIQPRQRSWVHAGKKIEAQPSADWVAVFANNKSGLSASELEILTGGAEPPSNLISLGKQGGKEIFGLPLHAVRRRSNEILSAAGDKPLPRVRAVYQVDGTPVIPLDSMVVVAKDEKEMTKVVEAAKKHHLRVDSAKGNSAEFELTRDTDFVTVLDAVSYFINSFPGLTTCEPNLTRLPAKLYPANGSRRATE